MIYQIILIFIIVFIYDQIKTLFFDKETFQTTITGYQADIEAIRNLSSIATQLTTSGLTVPGKLSITNNTNINGELTVDGITKVNTLYTGGGTNNNPGGGTHFPWRGDGNNYIRGNTIMDGDFNLNGNIQIANGKNATINGNLKVNGGINTVNGLATTAYGSGWSSIFYKLPTNFSGFFQVFVQGINTGYPSNDQGNKYLFATGFWVPNITSPIAPKQDTNVNNWTLKVDLENNGGTVGNPVIYLKSSSGGDRIWYSVITYPTPNHEGK